ncbi:MAG: sulfotransferase domain-containing protein [Terriglobia bacterium]
MKDTATTCIDDGALLLLTRRRLWRSVQAGLPTRSDKSLVLEREGILKRPNFFILGAPKCGTTSLASWLAEHPNIYMPSPKEPFFFDTDAKVVGRIAPHEYVNIYSQAQSTHIAVGEASTTYLYSRKAVPNILSYLGAVPRFIVCVRNPIEMAISLHRHLLFHGVETVKDFEAAWKTHGTRVIESISSSLGSHPSQIHYGPQCMLGEQIGRLFRSVPNRMVLVLVFEDLVRQPGIEYARVLNFLGVSDDHRQTFPIFNEGKEAKSISIARGMRFVTMVKQRFHIRKGLGIQRFITARNAAPKRNLKLSVQTLLELCEYFREDVKTLSQLLGRDFTDWIRPDKQQSPLTAVLNQDG